MRRHRVLTLRGWVRVAVCPLCAALVVDAVRHAAVHAADVRR